MKSTVILKYFSNDDCSIIYLKIIERTLVNMDKIQVKDLTTEYIVEKLQDAHPFFKLGKPILDKYGAGVDDFEDDVLSYARYANVDDNTNRSKDALLNYLRHSDRNDLFDITIKYEKNASNDIIQEFWKKTIDLSIKYISKQPYSIRKELSRAHKIVEGDNVGDLFSPHRMTARIRYLFVESPIENCIRLQAIISAPLIEDFVGEFDTYFSNLDEVIDILREQYEKTNDDEILDAANYIEDNKQTLYDSLVKMAKDTGYESAHGTTIDICDVELDPEVANLNVSVSKISNLTQEEYEDPIMSNNVLLKLLRLQRALALHLDYNLVAQYTKGRDRSIKERSVDFLTSNMCYQAFPHVRKTDYDHTTQKLLYYLNTRLKNSKAKTREREILKTFKARTAPIIERIKEIHKEVLPYAKTRNGSYLSEELLSELLQDTNTGKHEHTQAVLDKITSAVIEMKALCDGYNEEYRRMLDAIAEDL